MRKEISEASETPVSNPSVEELAELSEWVNSRPASVKAVMDRFPPAAYVVAKDGKVLFCPAPGERGIVERYLEDDDGRVTLGIAPLETDASGPMGVLPFLMGVGYAECDPDWLEVVDSGEQFALYAAALTTGDSGATEKDESVT